MTREQALLVIEEKREWADLISGEKDELYDALDVVLTELATLRTQRDALVKAGERVVSAQSCYGAEEAFTSSVDIDEAIDTLSAALAAAKGER